MYKVNLSKQADKSLKKILKSNPFEGGKIETFIDEILSNTPNPFALPNAKKMQGADNQYRWRIGNYRIIGDVYNDILVIEIIKVSSRQDAY